MTSSSMPMPRGAGARGLAASAALAGICLALTGCSSQVTSAVSSPPPVTELSSSDAERLIQAALDRRWEETAAMFPGSVRPDIERVRVVAPSEYATVGVDCLREEGFDVRALDDGGISYAGVPEAQQEALHLAGYVCAAKYPIDPKYAQPLSTEEAEYLYEYMTRTLVECLEREGYAVSSPPSRETFVSGLAEGVVPWTPYESVVADGDAWQRVNLACPQVPDGFRGH